MKKSGEFSPLFIYKTQNRIKLSKLIKCDIIEALQRYINKKYIQEYVKRYIKRYIKGMVLK